MKSASRIFTHSDGSPTGRLGFTLIELLVVIVVIVVLAALGMTMVGAARMKANQAESISNLKQWGSAMNTSLLDTDGHLPADGGLFNGADLGNLDAWFNRLPRYIGEKPLSDPEMIANPPRAGVKSVWINPAVPNSANARFVNPPKSFLFCYALNYYLSNSKSRTTKLSRIVNPAATVVMGEKGDNYPTLNPSKVKAYFGDGDVDKGPKNEANFLFCDGHVASFSREAFTSPSVYYDGTNPAEPIDSNFTFVPYVGADH